jgi:hypothetical protein
MGIYCWYKERRLNDMPSTAVGFLIIQGDTPYLFNERGLSSLNGGTSWEALDNASLMERLIDKGTRTRMTHACMRARA